MHRSRWRRSSCPTARRCPRANYVFACGPWLPKVVSAPARAAHLSHAPGSVFLRDARRRCAFRASARCPAGPISTTATSSTACPTWKGAASRSRTTSMVRPSIRIAATAWPHRVRWPMRAPTWRKRFPALANAPLNEERVCQYENSSNGDLLIDRHPTAIECVVGRCRIGAWVQARPRGRPLRGGTRYRQAQDSRNRASAWRRRRNSRIAPFIEFHRRWKEGNVPFQVRPLLPGNGDCPHFRPPHQKFMRKLTP